MSGENDSSNKNDNGKGSESGSDRSSYGGGTSINLTAIMSLSAVAPQFKHVAVLAEALSETVQQEREVFEDMFSKEEVEDIILDAKEIQIISSRIGEDIFDRLNDSIDTAIFAAEETATDEKFDSASEGLNVIDENMLTEEQLEKMLNGELGVGDLTPDQQAEFFVNSDNDLVSGGNAQSGQEEGRQSGSEGGKRLADLSEEEHDELVNSLHDTLQSEGFDSYSDNESNDDADSDSQEYKVLYDITDVRANMFSTYQELVKDADKAVGRAWTEKGKGYVYNGSRWVRNEKTDF